MMAVGSQSFGLTLFGQASASRRHAASHDVFAHADQWRRHVVAGDRQHLALVLKAAACSVEGKISGR
jgi:hypothetical protein